MKQSPLPSNKVQTTNRLFWCLLVAVTLLGLALIWYATWPGAGISPDSTVYISMARSYLNKLGYEFVLQSGGDFPPFYPALLALGGMLTGDPATAARPINALLFGANVFLVGWILKRILPDSFFAPLVGAVLMVFGMVMIDIHAMAWSEPTFLFFGLGGMIALASYLEHPQWWRLVVAALAMGLAAIDRYVGISLAATGILALLVLRQGTLRRKLGSILLFGLFSALPLAIVMLRRPTRRIPTFQIPPGDYFIEGWQNISAWIIPTGISVLTRFRPWLALVLVLGFVLALIWAVRRAQGSASLRDLPARVPILVSLVALFAVAYIAVNLFARIFLGPALTLHPRALSPLYVAGVILGVSGGSLIYARLGTHRLVRLGATLVVGAFLMATLVSGWRYVRYIHVQGLGYNSRDWQMSPTIARIRTLPPELVIYSNGSDAVYFLTGRQVVRTPDKVDKMNMRGNQIYLQQMDTVKQALADQRGVVVWFKNFPDRWFQPSDRDLQADLPLRLIAQETDGLIFR